MSEFSGWLIALFMAGTVWAVFCIRWYLGQLEERIEKLEGKEETKRADRAEAKLKHLAGDSEDYFVLSPSEMERYDRLQAERDPQE